MKTGFAELLDANRPLNHTSEHVVAARGQRAWNVHHSGLAQSAVRADRRSMQVNRERSVTRVVYIVSLFPCWSETFIVREISALIAQGVDVRIISLKHASETMVQADDLALLPRVHHPGSHLSAVSVLTRTLFSAPVLTARCIAALITDMWRRPAVLLKSLIALTRGLQHLPWLRDFSPHFIYSHWATYPSTVAWALSQIGKIRFGFTSHAHDIFNDQQLLARKLSDADVAVTISQFNVEWLTKHVSPIARDKLQIVHCGVDLAVSKVSETKREPAWILAVGRLDPIKGFATLIEAMHLLSQRQVDCRCSIVGEGPLRASLQALIDALGVARKVQLVGAKPQDEVRSMMERATLFALPCEVATDGNRDGIPVALMEAMAVGCPVLSAPVSGVPELIQDGVTGLLVETANPRALANAIQRLLEDSTLRSDLSRAARRKIEVEFDAASEASKLLKLMGEVSDVR